MNEAGTISSAGTAAQRRSDEAVLRSCIERIVAERSDASPSAIVAIEQTRSQFASFYAADVITVRLGNGTAFKLFLKNFGSFDRAKDTMEARRQREMVVYRDVLAGADLGTPRYYDSLRDESEGRFWLLLEFVEGVPMSHLKFEDWLPSAQWLGRMYGYFSRQPEKWQNCDALIQHDAAFFNDIAQQALRTMSVYSGEMGKRLAPIVERYAAPVQVMTSQPKTFVHGTYRPPQIIVDKTCRPMRICPVDFEKAAAGSSLYDLTFIADGFDTPRLHRLFEAYRAEAQRAGVSVPDNEEMTHIVDCFRLHRVMSWLAMSSERKYDDAAIHKLMEMAESIGRLVS
jgi:aminoglycoside phosphotransferase (APT) family kinase protein